jgi:hypothetical protein
MVQLHANGKESSQLQKTGQHRLDLPEKIKPNGRHNDQQQEEGLPV